jgi:hypothetical protein
MPVETMLLARTALSVRALTVGALLCLALVVATATERTAGRSPLLHAAGFDSSSRDRLSGLPVASKAAVSDALGADDTAFRILLAGGGFRAVSTEQHLEARWGDGGVLVSSGEAKLGLSLRAVGYGDSPHPLGDVAPTARANRVDYARDGVAEWYMNGPLGLEQGFTLDRAPAGDSSERLTLALELSSSAVPLLARDAHSLTVGSPSGPSLRYGDLVASDARGRTLPSRLELRSGRLLLRVDARGARYPLRIDPLIQQGSKLTGHGEVKGAFGGAFGWSVALSSDGNTAVIGGPFDNGKVGAAWVFTRSGETWTQQAKLTGHEEIGAGEFGDSVALSADGNTALIGGVFDNGKIGAAWVFTRSGPAWAQQGPKLTGAEELGQGYFGASVSLSADGDTAMVGGVHDNELTGAAWVFTRSGEAWAQQGPKLTAGGEIGAGYVGRVALSADGNTALIGGEHDDGFLGAAWVFTRTAEIWSQQAKLTGEGESGEGEFGQSVAISSDGGTALVGAVADNSFVGAAWVFTRTESTWTQQGSKLTGAEEKGEGWFGYSAALSSDGSTALLGGLGDNNFRGAAWAFSRSGSDWNQQGPKLTGGNETGEGQFGAGVSLSSDGSTALIGGPKNNSFTGAAWPFVYSSAPLPATVTGVSPRKGPAAGGISVTITGTNLSETTAVSFGATAAASFTVTSATTITAVMPAETAGTVDVTVTTPAGVSAVSSKDHFKVTPSVTGVTPNGGSEAGGTRVTVTGSGFSVGSAATIFTFQYTHATSVECASETTCTVVTPPHAPAKVDVRATVSGVTSPVKRPADQFTYN